MSKFYQRDASTYALEEEKKVTFNFTLIEFTAK